MICVPAIVYSTLLAAAPAQAQLNENCTISILNRTAQVQPDGSWRIDNVPAEFGAVRARATCVEGGITRSGQSNLFVVEAGIINGFDAEIVLGAVDPIPEALAVTAPVATLTAIGATTQLGVTASYPDGSTAEVSAASNGTNYTVSNSAVATVGADGLVTAVMSGTVLVTAMLEGALGLAQIQVVLSGDSDGDGIPDDVEIANGLDPENPVDGLEDADGDGLTNKQELVDFGTDFQAADTDGDGIDDGEEVAAGADGFVTNPLLADSDGDGLRDGLEIATGSDPTDAADFNLAAALDSIAVAPASFVLTVSGAGSEASVQLAVTGSLIDGTTIDLTAIASGTNYTSSDLGVCNFGAEDGRVFAGAEGSCTITAANSGFTAVASGTVQTFDPTPLGFVNLPGYANNVDVNGGYAYVAAGAAGLQVVDVSSPQAPVIVGAVDTPGNANDVQVVGNHAYVADGFVGGLQIIDVLDPAAPVIVGAADTPGEAQGVVVADMTAYVADGAGGGLQILDVSNPAAPAILGGVVTGGDGSGVDLSGDLAVLTGSASIDGVFVIDVADPSNPQILGTARLLTPPSDVVVRDGLAFVSLYTDSSAFNSIKIIDFGTPASPLVLGAIGGGALVARDLALSQQSVLMPPAFFGVLSIVDVADPLAPFVDDTLDFAPIGDYSGTGIAVTPEFVYMTGQSPVSTFFDNGDVGFSRLQIGQFRVVEDTGGVPPVVGISAPAPGVSVVEGATLPITVAASDDVAVAAVDVLVDGQVVFRDTVAPFAFNLTVPLGVSGLSLGATAFDLANNAAQAAPVAVVVTADPGTTAAGQVVDDLGVPVAGAELSCLDTVQTAAADGSFLVSGVPTVQGPVSCLASAEPAPGQSLRGGSAALPPVAGGTTSVGQIVVRELGSLGTDFWLALPNSNFGLGGEIHVLSDTGATFTVTGPGFSANGSAGPGSPGSVALPSSLEVISNELVEAKGLHLVSDAAVSVMVLQPGSSSDAYLGLPTAALGTDYLVVGYPEAHPLGGSFQNPSEFLIVATEDATGVTLVPSCVSQSGTPAGSPVNLVLNQGETYQYFCFNAGDVTGSTVSSDKPVAVIGGNGCGNVPPDTPFCDLMTEMLVPTALYDTEFYTTPLPQGALEYRIRVIAAEDGTLFTVDDGLAESSFPIAGGEFQELALGGPARITADRPISVTQYAVGAHAGVTGDPMQIQMLPASTFRDSYRLFSPSGFDATYAVIVAANAAVPSVTRDGLGVTGFAPLPGGSHQYVVAPVPAGQSVISADRPVAVYGIGFSPFKAYGYAAGL